MKKISILLVVLLSLGIVISVYSGGKNSKESTKLEVITKTPYKIIASPQDDLAEQMKRGEEIYKEICIICHMADGKGIPGAFPPLAKSDYLMADPVRAVAQTLNGSNEEMVVNGVTYNTPMTPQVDTKEDGIAVINYVLNNFGNDGGTVTMEDVKDVVVNPR